MSACVRVLQGHVLDVLATLPDESVHCVITSPPYYGLRSYGGWFMQTLWGDANAFQAPRTSRRREHWFRRLQWRAAARGGIMSPNGEAWIGALGLEPSLDLFLAHMVAILRDVRRVLRSDGTLWLNMGDSYAGSWGNYGPTVTGNGGQRPRTDAGQHWARPGYRDDKTWRPPTSRQQGVLKPKDLMLIPARLAIALQEDGWWVRSDVVWAKPNPMPESVLDRPVRAHEFLYLLTKSADYYYDSEAIREPLAEGSKSRYKYKLMGTAPTGHQNGTLDRRLAEQRVRDPHPAGRLKRDVWFIATESYSEAHFATFPPDLIEPCILAGTSAKGVCPQCGAPWRRQTEVSYAPNEKSGWGAIGDGGRNPTTRTDLPKLGATRMSLHLGWEPSCTCPEQDHSAPAVLLDPFGGSGTTGMEALRHGRSAILIEINPAYVEMMQRRIEGDAPMFNTVAVSEAPAQALQASLFS